MMTDLEFIYGLSHGQVYSSICHGVEAADVALPIDVDWVTDPEELRVLEAEFCRSSRVKGWTGQVRAKSSHCAPQPGSLALDDKTCTPQPCLTTLETRRRPSTAPTSTRRTLASPPRTCAPTTRPSPRRRAARSCASSFGAST
jgi:hypothetical protein